MISPRTLDRHRSLSKIIIFKEWLRPACWKATFPPVRECLPPEKVMLFLHNSGLADTMAKPKKKAKSKFDMALAANIAATIVRLIDIVVNLIN